MRRTLKSPKRGLFVLTVVALGAICLLAVSSIMLASNQVRTSVNRRVQATVAVSAVVIGQQTSGLVELVSSYATRPSLIAGMQAGTGAGPAVQSSLASLAQARPGISASFVTDIHGTSLDTYPPEPSVYGTNFAYRNWFKGLVMSGRPYVSNAIETHEASHALAVTVTDYIRGENGRPIGVLGINYGLQSIRSFAAAVGRAQGIALTVTDRAGTSLTTSSGGGLVSMARDPRVRAALAGSSGLLDYSPVLADGRRGKEQLSAYAPVAGTGWAVIASVNKSTALSGLVRLRDLVLAISAVLVLMLLGTVRSVARSDRRQRDSARQIKSQDQALARLLESTHEAYFATDRSGIITAWNAQAEKLYGWSQQEALGRKLSDTVVPAVRLKGHLADLKRFRSGGGSDFIGTRSETVALHRDGHELPVEASSWANENNDGFSAFVHDISDRVAIHEEMARARDEAMKASQLKSEFLANMSHEIRTPMNGVIGMSNLLLNTDLDVTQRDYADTVCASAAALLTVIDDVLDFSKIEAGKLDVECVAFDLRSVIEQSALLLAASAEEAGLELTCRIDPTLPVAVNGDPGRLRQVLVNLLGNAVKFTSAGEVNLTASMVEQRPGDTVMVELAVHDTGIGMTGETLEHLFEAFSQADSSTSRRYGGTGLGLAISRQLVELMGGKLTVVSELGVGSTFTVLIPYAPAVAAPSTPEVADLVGVHALIVDDNLTNRHVLEEMVAVWGCSSVTTDGAEAALALLRAAVDENRPFDVLLLDLNMPGVDGYGLARAVCADPKLAHTPMVVLTSSAKRGEAEKTQQAGVVAYLTKPIFAGRLRGALDVALSAKGAVVHKSDRHVASPGLVNGRMLVVEDHVINQRVLTTMLASLGYRADVATNGVEALEAIRLERYDAVFMDCQMPVMDGYEATKKLRETEGADRHLCVIAVTATAMTADRERCIAIGMDDYLPKPISMAGLAAVLARWIPQRPDRGNGAAMARVGGTPAAAAGDAADLLQIDRPSSPNGAEPTGPDTPALDAQVVTRLERLGNAAGEDLMAQLSTLFLADADVRLSAMRLAFAGGDDAELIRSAHAMTGASANVGASVLAGLCATLEADGLSGCLAEGQDQLDAVQSELGRVRLALNLRTRKS